MPMTRFVLGRLAWMAAILLGVSIIAFTLMRAIPGDFAIAAAGSQSVAPDVLATIRRDLGLDQPRPQVGGVVVPVSDSAMTSLFSKVVQGYGVGQ